jgi:hypothetical protein
MQQDCEGYGRRFGGRKRDEVWQHFAQVISVILLLACRKSGASPAGAMLLHDKRC